MLRWSVRSLLLVVLLIGVFLAGVKLGQQWLAYDGPGPRAMAFVKTVPTSNDREATAIFNVAMMLETSTPGILRSRPDVKAIPGSDSTHWKVVFVDPTSKLQKTVNSHFGGALVKDFVRKRDQGFKLVLE